MDFVRHSGKPEWGLGVVLAERGCAVDILFEGVGYKRMTPGFAKLVAVRDAEVPADHPLRDRAHWSTLARGGRPQRAQRRV